MCEKDERKRQGLKKGTRFEKEAKFLKGQEYETEKTHKSKNKEKQF